MCVIDYSMRNYVRKLKSVCVQDKTSADCGTHGGPQARALLATGSDSDERGSETPFFFGHLQQYHMSWV